MEPNDPPPWPYAWMAFGAAVAIVVIVLFELGGRIWP